MKKLYMIGLGGSIQGANIEVHDMQFVFADKIEDCYQELKNRWYGDSLHMDSYTEVHTIDGYQIDFTVEETKNLYMVVFGGYKKGTIDELHSYHFVLASSKQEAKNIGKSLYHRFDNMDHIDEVVDVFQNAGARVGWIKGDYSFVSNNTVHTFVKLK